MKHKSYKSNITLHINIRNYLSLALYAYGLFVALALCASTAMGDPPYNSKQYKNKLKKTKLSKALKRQQTFQKKAQVVKLVRAACAQTRKACFKEQAAAVRRGNVHWRAKNKLEKDNKELKATNQVLHKDLATLRNKLKAARTENFYLSAENERLQQRLSKWKLFWAWVEAHAAPKTLAWLLRLWERGPRPARDACWGGGQ